MITSTNKIKTAINIAELVSKHYEPGNQSKSMANVFTTIVNPIYPMSERTFWRHISYAQEHLGYDFSGDGLYLDETFESMLPTTIEKVKTMANEALKIGTKGKTKKEIFELNESRIAISYQMFIKYLNIAEIYLGYKFDFKESKRVKEKRNSRKLASDNLN